MTNQRKGYFYDMSIFSKVSLYEVRTLLRLNNTKSIICVVDSDEDKDPIKRDILAFCKKFPLREREDNSLVLGSCSVSFQTEKELEKYTYKGDVFVDFTSTKSYLH